MPTYVMLANWTDQGLKSIADGPRRVDAARKTLEEMGGHFRSLYMTMGQYDLVGIYEAPDDAVAARYILLLGQLGRIGLSRQTCKTEQSITPDLQLPDWKHKTYS